MTKHDEVEQRAKSIEVSLANIEAAADPALKTVAQELVRALMELHGAGLKRMLAIVRELGDSGGAVVARFGNDELVRSVLLLYGLHPDDIRTRVGAALEATRASLKPHGATAELVSVDENGVVTVRVHMQSSGCGSSSRLAKQRIEAALEEAAPDAARIVVEDRNIAVAGPGFVPISELQGGEESAGISDAQAARSGD
jgi:Fe-S cluster biogenesis protein NfuA